MIGICIHSMYGVKCGGLMKERRKHTRIRVTNRSVMCKDKGHLSLNLIKDISQGGIGFWARDEFEIGDDVYFRFELPEQKEADIEGMGKIMWHTKSVTSKSKPFHWHGMSFVNLSKDARKQLIKFFQKD